MAKKKSKPLKKTEKVKELSWYYLAPILFIVAIVPLIVFGRVLEIEGLEMLNWKGGSTSIDFFSYYKSVYFVAASFISFILIVLLQITGQFKILKSKYYIPLGIYVVFVVLSFIFADDRTVASRGFIELFQGVYVLVGYALVIVATMNLVQNEKHVKITTGAYVFVGIITALIGISQYFGFDFFRTMFARHLILPEYLHHIAESLEFTFGKYTIYATMYNTNFVGSFAALLVPISLALYLFAQDKKWIALSAVFTALMVFVWFGSNSRAGLVGVTLGLIVFAVMFRKILKKNIKKITIPVALIIVVMVILNTVSDGRVMNQITRLSLRQEASRIEASTRVRFEDIRFEGNRVSIITDDQSLVVSYDGEQMIFTDLEFNPLAIDVQANEIRFEDSDFASFRVIMEEEQGRFIIRAYHQRFEIYFTETGFRMAGSGGVLGVTEYPPRVKWMDGFETFGSSRGYIWSRSIPMLRDTLIIGHGPDMYAIMFPQRDYVGKSNSYASPSIIVDKPHNMFLQIGINTGVISLIALLVVLAWYLWESFRLYFKKELTTFTDYMAIACMVGIIGYLGAAFFNDQIISVAPLFYVMIGLGIAINRINQKQIEKIKN